MSAKVNSVIIDVHFPVEWSADENLVRKAIVTELSWSPSDLGGYRVLRKNLDARKKNILAIWRIEAVKSGDQLPPIAESPLTLNALPPNAPEAHVIGAGPAGLFAALNLIRKGIRPIILERGQPVRQRRRDLVNITRNHRVDRDSNYCFGEGGAGTYSDGKLYTRSHKRGNIEEALRWFVHFGADPEILVDAHPHIGTNKLPQIIERMREVILQAGGQYRFGARLLDIETENGTVSAIRWLDVESGEEHVSPVQKLILATGHSARDIFELFDRKGWKLESKPFAMGVRVEHSQQLIDEIQYHGKQRGDWLPPASYRLVCQVNGRGVHSFCMCPGGIIAPCATEPEQIVTNGWSPSKRNNPFANSGMVVQLDEKVWQEAGFDGVLGGLHFQRHVERMCWEAAGRTQQAPAQRLIDFVHGKRGRISSFIPQTSYLPGVVSVNLRELLPEVISDALAEGFREFGKRMPLFLDPQAVIVAPESRTSSPIRIPRDPVALNHPEVEGVYPCGEGGGYAGGILSAALDGLRVSDQVVESF